MKLTEKQLNIVNSVTYPQYVRAGAGTGKTEVLINKILYILKYDTSVDLSNFGIITFINKAAEELRARLSKAIYAEWLSSDNECNDYLREQAELVDMIEIGTIHNFCENIIREYGVQFGIPTNFKIKSFRKEMIQILDETVVKEYQSEILKDIPQYKVIKLLDALLTNNYNHGIILDEYCASDCLKNNSENDFWGKFKKAYLEMYLSAYYKIEAAKSKLNILTPNDLVAKAAELLQEEYIALKVAEKFKYVFIDEFQDTNLDQFHLVQLLIKYGVKIFLVGDDKQSIYGFRGADVENSVNMHNIIKDLQLSDKEEIYLNENFRSDRLLIELINKIFSQKYRFNGKIVKFPYEPLAIPENIDCEDYEHCLEIRLSEEIENTIKDLSENQNIPYGDIAILCRRNYDLDKISANLKEQGYPVEVVGGKGFYRAKEIIDTYKILNALINCNDEYQREIIFTDYYKSAISSKIITESCDKLIEEFRTILRRETVEEALTYIYDKSMILDYYRANRQYQAIANLNKLKDIARELINRDGMQPIQFLDYLNIMINSGQDEDEADIAEAEREKGVIRVYSIHKSKGLSFPVVIIPCIETNLNRPITKPKIIFSTKDGSSSLAFNSKELSNKLKSDAEYIKLLESKTLEQLEEELRIFYVACTRAKHKLVLVSSKSMENIASTYSWKENASIAKWLMQIDNGDFVKHYSKNSK